MKSIRKFLCVLLAVLMCVSMLGTPVWAADTGHTHEGTLPQVSCTYINPLYADILTEADLVSRPPVLASGNNSAVYATYATTVEAAGRTLRNGMKDRQETVNVYIQIPADDVTDEYLNDLFYLIADAALVHTGVPTEGDYLAWQYGGWEASVGGEYVGDNANLTYTYTLTYYTSAAQEDKVDSAVSKLLSDLNVSGKDDYTKILAVYGYICDNVTYDYDHLNDDNYKLQYTAYGALIDGTSVCQGYAVLLYRLALELGVDSRLIAGIGNGGPHGWNIVEMENLYYNADSTWDAGASEYDYFLKSDDNFPDHDRYDEYKTSDFYAAYPMGSSDYVVCSHSYSSVVTPPTCTEQGYTTHTCSKCGDSYVDTYVDATGHSYGEWVVTTEPTCTEKGTETRTCANCKASETRDVDATGHSFGEWAITTEPTCTEKGIETRTCANCGATQTRDVDATGHSFGDWVVTTEPTCTEKGTETSTCSVCGATETRDVDATGHSFGDWVVTTEPTCTEKGSETRTCSVCGATETRDVDATGHSFGEWTVTTEPTCTEKGTETSTCANCGATQTRDVDAAGHSFGEWVVTTEPTCTEKGTETRTCSVCEATETQDVEATGHSFGDWTVTTEPTCIEKGSETRTCSVCSATETKDVDALGHDFVDGECIRCGEILVLEAPALLSIFSREQTSCKATWVPVEGADGYELWRTTAPEDEESWRRIKTIKDGTQDRYTNQGLEIGTTYYYKVRAYIGEEEATRVYSEFSQVKYMPAAVVFDGPYSNSTFRIRLRWEEIGGADGYQIWRLDDTGTWKIIKTIGDKGNILTNDQGATVAYSNVGLEAGKQYTYKMRAFSIPEDGVKVYGAYSDAYTVVVKPETPELTITSTKAGRATLEWNAVNGAAGYQIWMAESENGEYKIVKSIKDGSTTSYNKYDLQSGKTYYFKIRAYAEVDGKMTFSAFTDIKSVRAR